MGFLNFESQPYHMKVIERVLGRRGLKPDFESDWEIHGPHQDMNYQVYVGYAKSKPEGKCIWSSKKIIRTGCSVHDIIHCVAIYPKSVYEIEEPEKWGEDAIPENRIYTK